MPVPSPAGPLIVACLRVTDLRAEVDPLTGVVHHPAGARGLSAADAAALEHALRFAEAWGGSVVAVAAVDRSAEPVLAEVATLGATVHRVDAPAGGPADDERAVAEAVAGALAPYGTPTLVVCGDRSVDRGTGAFPAFLAHRLGAAQALGLVSLAPGGAPGDGTVVAERRLDGGWRERLRVPCPAVCSVEAAGVRLRRAPLPAVLAAADHPVTTLTPPAPAGGVPSVEGPSIEVTASGPFRPRTRVVPAPGDADPRLRLLALTGALAEHEPPTVVGPVGAAEAADALLAFLGRHGYLDGTPFAPSAGEGT